MPQPAHPIEALTAAAERIDVARRDLKIRPKEWQKQAWNYYDEIEIVRYAARYMGNSIGRLKPLVAGRIEEQNVPLNPDDAPEGFRPEDIRTADKILKSLAMPNGIPEILRASALNLFQTGECWLVGRPSETEPDEQMWDIASVEQIISDSSGVKYKESMGQTTPTLLDKETVALRIWLKHPRWPKDPDSPNRACLNILKELMLLTDLIEATATSRIPAGMVAIPDSFDAATVNPEDKETSFASELVRHMSTSVKESRSAARLVPFIVRGPKDDIAAIKDFDFSRDISQLAIQLRQELRERYAAGVDLPPEILTGKGDTNHWQAWNIDENAFANHIAPLAAVIFEALTMIYLQPALQASQIENWEDYLVDYDSSDLVLKPDQTDTVEWAHENFLLSDDATRRHLNLPDHDAPDDQEITRRVNRAIAIASRNTEGTAGPMAEDEPERTAAATVPGTDLGEWEATLQLRLLERADAAMLRALEKAGARLRTAASRNQATKEQIASAGEIPNELLAFRMPDLVAAAGQTEEELLAASFAAFLTQWDSLTKQAQDRLLNLAADGLTQQEHAEAQRIFDQHREATKPALEAALVGLASGLLYNPTPQQPEQGEFDPHVTVPPGLIRGSVALAGGAALTLSPTTAGGSRSSDGRAISGLYTAPASWALLSTARNLEPEGGLIWRHGTPSRPFPPHEALHLQTLSSYEDPKLQAFGWPNPPGGFYMPGDHAGCTCQVSVLVNEVGFDLAG